MKKQLAYSSLFLMLSVIVYMTLFFVYGDLKLENVHFAGETVPKEKYDIIEKKMVWNNKQFLKRIYIKNKENEYLEYITSQIEDFGLPEDIKYIPYVESSLNPNAVSSAGAVGFWQIMPDTGRQYGMRIDDTFDERYDIEVSTSVALEYFLSLRDEFPSWTLSVAAYNRGPNRIRQDILASGTKNFYDMDTNTETKEYMYKILAYKYGR